MKTYKFFTTFIAAKEMIDSPMALAGGVMAAMTKNVEELTKLSISTSQWSVLILQWIKIELCDNEEDFQCRVLSQRN